MPLTAGLTAETDVVVEDHLTADRMGNPEVRIAWQLPPWHIASKVKR